MNGAQATQTRWKVLCCEAVKSLLTVLMIATLAWVFFKSGLPSDAVCAVDRNGIAHCGPPPPLFQRLHGFWQLLLYMTAVAWGASGVRHAVLRSSLAYGLGMPLGWIAMWISVVLADPALHDTYAREIAGAALIGGVIGALMAALGLLLRYLAGWMAEFRRGAVS